MQTIIYQPQNNEEAIDLNKVSIDSIAADEMSLNEIRVMALTPDVVFVLNTDRYDIESANTAEARVKPVLSSTAAAVGSQPAPYYAVQKLARESVLATVVPAGQLRLVRAEARAEGKDEETQLERVLVSITLRV